MFAALLCATTLILSEVSASRKHSNASIINMAGWEIALSERVLSNIRVANGKDVSASEKAEALTILQKTVSEWRKSHLILVEKASVGQAKDVLSAIENASPAKEQLTSLARSLVDSGARLPVSLSVAKEVQIQFAKGQMNVLRELERFDSSQLASITHAHRLSIIVLALLILFQSWAVFAPLIGKQRESIRRLEEQHDALENAQAELAAQNSSLLDSQAALENAISRSEDMTRLSRYSASRFEELFAGLPIAAFTFDSAGCVFEWNREAEVLFGIGASQALGHAIPDLIALPENVDQYELMVTGVFASDHIYNVERRIRRPNGETRLVLFNAFPLKDPEGRITGGVCSMVDVTEQRSAESKLRDSERRFREMVENLPTGAILVEQDNLHINRYVEQMTGFHKSELRSLDEWFESIYRERAFDVRSAYEIDQAACFPVPRIVPITAKDGTVRHIEFIAQRSEETEVWIMQDVSERLASHERFKVLFEYSSDAHLLFDETGIVDCNEATVRLLGGVNKEQILAQHPAVFSPEHQPDGRRSDEKCIEMDSLAKAKRFHRFEWMHRKMDGTDFPVEVTLTTVNIAGRDTLLTVWHDLTEQKAAQEALRTAVAELSQAQSIARVGSWQCDKDFKDAWFSPEMKRIMGKEDIEAPYDLTALSKIVHPDDSKSFRRNLLEAVRRRTKWEQELRIIWPDGQERIMICTGKPLDDGTKYLGTLQDVTEDRHAALRVAESEALFRSTLDAMHSGVVFMDSSERIIRTNPKGAEILGLTVAQILGTEPIDPKWGNIQEDWSDLPDDQVPLIAAFRTGEPVESFVHGVRKPDGTIIWISVNSAPVFLPNQDKPTGAVSSFTDITEARRQQELLLTEMVRTNEQAVTLELQKIELEMMNEKLEGLATTDGLTGLNNHRRFQEYLDQEFAIARRNGSPLSLILLDVDHFKKFNDEFGHQAGDEVLRGVARALESAARDSDFVARYGGEEFVIVLPGTDLENSIPAAERFRRVIEACEWPYQSVTASFGVATLDRSISDREKLIAVADSALYTAKRNGRNRVHHADSVENAA